MSNNNNTSEETSQVAIDPCDKTFLLRKHGLKGLAVAGLVLVVVLIIIMLSKLNEVRHYRVPMIWRKKVRKMIENSAKSLKNSQNSTDKLAGYHYALEAKTILHSARDLVGDADLSSITNYRLDKLEADIEFALDNNAVPHLIENTAREEVKPKPVTTVTKRTNLKPL
jgi:hypothetical protein